MSSVPRSSSAGPILLTTWSFGLRAGRRAWELLRMGGSALDAVENAAIDAEDDPAIDSVGYGGLPDRDGEVTLDACVMLAPRRSGGVCALRATRHAASVARRVMERTPHVLLAGQGADAFARDQGFDDESLLAPHAADAWRAWHKAPHAIDQSADAGLAARDVLPVALPDDEARHRHHDTIGTLALDASGTLAGACSTSGTPYKLPGRVGDSPIVGHGLYVDPGIGAATATGTGELAMGVCASFLAVEFLRQGATPAHAVERTLRRIQAAGPLEQHHQVGIIVLRADGTWSAGSLRSGYRTAFWSTFNGPEGGSVVEPEVVLLPDGRPSPGRSEPPGTAGSTPV